MTHNCVLTMAVLPMFSVCCGWSSGGVLATLCANFRFEVEDEGKDVSEFNYHTTGTLFRVSKA